MTFVRYEVQQPKKGEFVVAVVFEEGGKQTGRFIDGLVFSNKKLAEAVSTNLAWARQVGAEDVQEGMRSILGIK